MTSASIEHATTSERGREEFNLTQLNHLEDSWKNGMTSTKQSCHSLIVKVAAEIEIPEDKVKIWIGNRRAKEAKLNNGNTKKYAKKKTYSRGPTAYSLFASSQPKGDMDGRDYLKQLGVQWKSLDPACVQKFQAESKELRCTLLKGRSRSEVISQETKTIQNSIMTLAEVGFEIGGFGTDPENILNSKNDICFVTSKTESFFTRDMFDTFKEYICRSDTKTPVSNLNTCQPKNTDRKKTLQKKLRKHLRQCWENSMGLMSSVPYKAIIKKEYKVIGLPSDLSFKQPHMYSNENMERILKLPITFHQGNIVTETVTAQEHGDMIVAELPEKEIEVPEKLGDIIVAELPENEIEVPEKLGDMIVAELPEKEIEVPETLEEMIAAELQVNEIGVPETTDLDQLMQQVSKPGASETGMRRKRKAPKRKYTTKKKLVQENKLYEVEEIMERKEGQVYVKWLVDGSFSWLPEENLVTKNS